MTNSSPLHTYSTPLLSTPSPPRPSIDLTVGAGDHAHRFVPSPAGRLYGKLRWRNRCVCGTAQNPEAPTDGWDAPRPMLRGPLCLRCGFPTADGTVDPDQPLHPCCAEPGLMALGRKARLTRLKEAAKVPAIPVRGAET